MTRWSTLLGQRTFRHLLIAGGGSLAAPTGSLIVISWALAHAVPAGSGASDSSAIALALLGLSSTVPTLAAAFVSGTLADRLDRKALMRSVNLIALFATVAISAILLQQPSGLVQVPLTGGLALPMWVLLIYPFWAVETTAITLFRPAFNASLPRVVARADLGTANGLVYATALVLSIGVGLSAAGLASVVPWAYALLVPVGLFAVTQAALFLLEADLTPKRDGPLRKFLADAADGYRYLARRRELLKLTIAALAINFFSAVAFVELGLYATFWLQVSSALLLGALISAGSLGAAVGGLLVNRLKFEPRAGTFLVLCTIGQGVSVLALGLFNSIWEALPDMFLFGIFPGMFTTVFLATIQSTVPDDKLGRVLAADEVGSYGLVPVGQWVGGLLTVETSVQVTYLSAGAGTALVGLAMAALSDLRRLGFDPHRAIPPTPPSPATGDTLLP